MRLRLTLAALMTAAIFILPGVSSGREAISGGNQGAQSTGQTYGGGQIGAERGGAGKNIYGRSDQSSRAMIGPGERGYERGGGLERRGYERYGRYGYGKGGYFGRSAPEGRPYR
jgi:hypothetical protein